MNHRTDLRNIARQAMIERGLWPDFSPKAMAELARIRLPPQNNPRGCAT